jgi:5'-nucleotidase / UDP-sugar diphosphatase
MPVGEKDKYIALKKYRPGKDTAHIRWYRKTGQILKGSNITGDNMKRFIIPLLLFFLFGIFLPVASFAEGNRTITILYTGFVEGNIAPYALCGCGAKRSGGLARRAHIIESIRKDKRSVLLLDCGAVFDPQIDNAELHLKAMGLMGYDALNLGSPELHFGKEFLERTHSQVSFPYVASNLFYGGSRLPWTREYIIKDVGGIKVAILGILDPDDLKNISRQDDAKGFEVIPPEAALNRLLPKVRGKADLVILLSQLDEVKNRALVEAARGVDVIVSSGRSSISYKEPFENTAVILHTGFEGMTLGLVTITLDDKRGFSVSERRDVPLDRSVPNNVEILGLVETYQKEQATKNKKLEKEKMEKMEKELMEGLKLSPQEFMERNRKALLF